MTGFETQTSYSTVFNMAVNPGEFIQIGVFVGQLSGWRFRQVLVKRVNVIISYICARAYMYDCQTKLFFGGLYSV